MSVRPSAVGEVAAAISGYRFAHGSEDALQEAVAEVLSARWTVERERRLDDRSRLDVYLPELRVAVECKVAGPVGATTVQCRRYLDHPDVDGLVLVTRRARFWMPPGVTGDQFAVVSLAAAAL